MPAPCRICGEESILNEAGVCSSCQRYRPTYNRFGEKIFIMEEHIMEEHKIKNVLSVKT